MITIVIMIIVIVIIIITIVSIIITIIVIIIIIIDCSQTSAFNLTVILVTEKHFWHWMSLFHFCDISWNLIDIDV